MVRFINQLKNICKMTTLHLNGKRYLSEAGFQQRQTTQHKKGGFSLRISSVNVVTFTEEILNGKFQFLCSANVFHGEFSFLLCCRTLHKKCYRLKTEHQHFYQKQSACQSMWVILIHSNLNLNLYERWTLTISDIWNTSNTN